MARKKKKLFNLEIEFGTIFSCNLTKIPEVMVNKTIKAVKDEKKRIESCFKLYRPRIRGQKYANITPKLIIKIEPYVTN